MGSRNDVLAERLKMICRVEEMRDIHRAYSLACRDWSDREFWDEKLRPVKEWLERFIEEHGADEVMWKIWFAYWIGRHHGKIWTISNIVAYIRQGKSLPKALEEAARA